MMNKARRVMFVLIAVMAFVIPSVKSAKAAAWHNTKGQWWKVDKICKDGAQVTLINPMNNGPLQLSFTAYLSPAEGPAMPTMLEPGQHVPLDQEIGVATVYAYEQRTPYVWDDANWYPREGSTRFWGVNAILFTHEFTNGETVAVQISETHYYTFIGVVNSNCTVK